MPGRLSVLFVGPMELASVVRDALVLCGRSRLSVATSYWDLCSLSLRESGRVHVAILDRSFSARELHRRAEYVRRRWADAFIILLSDDCRALDDPLYDQRLPAAVQPEDLVDAIERLTGTNEEIKREHYRARTAAS